MFTPHQLTAFHRKGYLIVSGFVPKPLVAAARARFEPLFRGEFETGLQPDEWNWRYGVSDEQHTRQICNGWKSDTLIAKLVLRESVGKACATLMQWPGTRINQDNVIWKPPQAKPLGFHQDDAYQDWIVPSDLITCWMALDDTTEQGGTIEYVPGSHHWPVQHRTFAFHAPPDYHEGLRYTARQLSVKDYKIDKITVQAGDAVFHHGRTWHGSGTNRSGSPRRSVVAHCMSSDSAFHPTRIGPIYSRYKRFGCTVMDESFFPITYREDGYRSPVVTHLLASTQH